MNSPYISYKHVNSPCPQFCIVEMRFQLNSRFLLLEMLGSHY